MSERRPPRVFLVHSSKDKARFVTGLAENLWSKGVDVWLDQWKMLPGDSLVSKIFEEGLKHADAVVIVLSKTSVTRPWVREELNASVIRRIEDGTRLIPILIDDCDVPEALRSTVWLRIEDPKSYGEQLDGIVAAIFESRPKSRVGTAPDYTHESARLASLSMTESATLRAFGEIGVESGDCLVLDTEEAWRRVKQRGVSRQDFEEATEELTERGYLEPSEERAPFPPDFSLRPSGFAAFASVHVPHFEQLLMDLAGLIVNEGLTEHSVLAEATGQPEHLIRMILDVLESRGLVRIRRAIGGYSTVAKIRPGLRRLLR